MSTAAVSSSSAVTTSSTGKESQVLSSDEFLQLMITELTNQDPMEPMSNQELLNQMATIQKLESDRMMTNSFEQLMDKFNGLIDRETLSTATRMIGELVSGTDVNGQYTMGRIIAVGMDSDQILVELDTGQQIAWENVSRLGGKSQQDLVGEFIIGRSQDGDRVAGTIEAVELEEESVILHVRQNNLDGTPGELTQVNLQNARILTSETADLLIGQNIVGYDQSQSQAIAGEVDSVQWSGESVLLNILNSNGESLGQVALQNMIDITSMTL